MKTSFEVEKKEFTLFLDPATVIHANKFTGTSGGWGSLPVHTSLYADIVFRSKESGVDWPVRIKDLDLPLYTNQEVMVISIEQYIIGYIDKQTNKYHYTETDFAYVLDLGFPLYKIWIGGIAAGIAVFLVTTNPDYKFFLCFVPLLIGWLMYRIKKWMINREIIRKLDYYLCEQ